MQVPESWLSYAYLYINSLSIKTIRPTDKRIIYYYTHHKIPIPMMQYSTVAIHHQLQQKASKGKGSSF